MKFFGILFLFLISFLPLMSQADEKRKALKESFDQVVRTTFKAADANANGVLSKSELDLYRSYIFLAMDYDENNVINLEEFLVFDPGFVRSAEKVDRKEDIIAAATSMFNQWDTDRNGGLTQKEHERAMDVDFLATDKDQDGYLNINEYKAGFPIIKALKSIYIDSPSHTPKKKQE